MAEAPNRGRPPKAATVKADVKTLGAILNLAVDSGRLASNPCPKLRWKRGETDSSRDRILSDEEESAVMPHLARFFEVERAVRVALNTGMREMEMLRLHERDFDLAARTVSFVAKGGKRRLLPLNDGALSAVAELLACRPPSGHLFRNRSRYQLSTEGPFGQACRDAGVRGLVFHDLRRTFSVRVQRAVWYKCGRRRADFHGAFTEGTANLNKCARSRLSRYLYCNFPGRVVFLPSSANKIKSPTRGVESPAHASPSLPFRPRTRGPASPSRPPPASMEVILR